MICPKCGSGMTFHSTYERHVHIDEIVEWLTIQRVICSECGGTHAVIPDFIRPYKHYSTYDSEMSLRDVDNGVPIEQVETAASISTLRRWVSEFREKSHQAAGALRALLFRHYTGTISEVQLCGSKIFGVLERILEKLPRIRSSSFVIGDTNIWLTNYIAGIFV